jgi:predicted transcriptional regulator
VISGPAFVHPADEATFAGILGAGEAVSAGALSRKLDVNLTAMNERLSKLSNLGIARWEKSSSASGRGQYVYKVMGRNFSSAASFPALKDMYEGPPPITVQGGL